MHSMSSSKPIRVGLMADEPVRMAGLTSIFEECSQGGGAPVLPVAVTMKDLATARTLDYVVVDLNASSDGLETLEAIRRLRPSLRQIVIGPEGNDELVMNAIVAGARAYLDLSASPRMVRQAIDVVTSGSIWAPRRLLSKLIDRLLAYPDSSLTSSKSHVTDRERQVLELILKARSNREIGRQLGIEERTVKAHVGRLMRKAGVDNRVELSMRASNGSMAGAPFLDRRRGERRQSPRPPSLPKDEKCGY
jgi:DNA-binding NarL/FixJ family response regulator